MIDITSTDLAAASVKPAQRPRRTPYRASRKVAHFYRTEDLDFSASTGITIPTLCGLWQPAKNTTREGTKSSISAGDCKRCIRVMTARGITLVE